MTGLLDKNRAEEDASFCLIKDGIFFSLFLSNKLSTGGQGYLGQVVGVHLHQ
jgi:hypothetical protein